MVQSKRAGGRALGSFVGRQDHTNLYSEYGYGQLLSPSNPVKQGAPEASFILRKTPIILLMDPRRAQFRVRPKAAGLAMHLGSSTDLAHAAGIGSYLGLY